MTPLPVSGMRAPLHVGELPQTDHVGEGISAKHISLPELTGDHAQLLVVSPAELEALIQRAVSKAVRDYAHDEKLVEPTAQKRRSILGVAVKGAGNLFAMAILGRVGNVLVSGASEITYGYLTYRATKLATNAALSMAGRSLADTTSKIIGPEVTKIAANTLLATGAAGAALGSRATRATSRAAVGTVGWAASRVASHGTTLALGTGAWLLHRANRVVQF